MSLNKRYTIKYIFVEGFYWTAVCPVSGFMVAYMQSKGFSGTYVGMMMAISNIVLAILQPIIAAKADKSSWLTLRKINIGFTLITLFSVVMMIFTGSMAAALTGVVTISITAVNAMQPFTNAVSVELAERGIDVNFGFCRAFGSLFYAIISTITGRLMSDLGYDCLPYVSIVVLVLLLISLAFMDDGSKVAEKNAENIEKSTDESKPRSLGKFLLENRKFCLFLIAMVCIFHTHMASNNYLINIVENVRGDSSSMGKAAAIAAICELPLMILFGRLCQKIRVQTLIRIGGIMFVVKFILLTVGTSLTAVFLAQMLQGLSYAILIPANVYYIGHLFSGADMNKGQSLSTAAICISTVTASIIGGFFIDHYGVTSMMTISTIISAMGVIILFLSLEEIKE